MVSDRFCTLITNLKTMADTKVSALPEITTPADASVVPIVQ